MLYYFENKLNDLKFNYIKIEKKKLYFICSKFPIVLNCIYHTKQLSLQFLLINLQFYIITYIFHFSYSYCITFNSINLKFIQNIIFQIK